MEVRTDDGILKKYETPMVDALLQIIVPKISDIDGLEVTQPYYEWDGGKYPQTPRVVRWRDVTLSYDEKTTYLKDLLPKNYIGEDWVWLKVSDETLDHYDISIKSGTESGNESSLETFLRLFLKETEKWVVAFILHYDQIDSVYQQDLTDLISKLATNLNENTMSEGFVSYR
jgi:hypothetical protein